MSIVIDCSYSLAWIYSDEISPSARQILEIVTTSGAWVPSIWPLEVGNSLQSAVRQGRIETTFRDAALADLKLLDIRVDTETNSYAWSATLQLSQKFKLTLYDACYLELAQRRSLPLASLDKELRAAAKSAGLVVM